MDIEFVWFTPQDTVQSAQALCVNVSTTNYGTRPSYLMSLVNIMLRLTHNLRQIQVDTLIELLSRGGINERIVLIIKCAEH